IYPRTIWRWTQNLLPLFVFRICLSLFWRFHDVLKKKFTRIPWQAIIDRHSGVLGGFHGRFHNHLFIKTMRLGSLKEANWLENQWVNLNASDLVSPNTNLTKLGLPERLT